MTWLTGERNGPPIADGAPVGDMMCGMLLVQGILGALLVREKTGQGQEVSASILDGLFTPQCEHVTDYLNTGRQPSKVLGPLYRMYLAKDNKWLQVSGAFGRDTLPDVCQVLGLPDLSRDERFNTPEKANRENVEELESILAGRFLTRNRDEWLELLEEKDILCGPVSTYEETFSDPQVLRNEMVLEFHHPRAGTVRTVGMPVKFSNTPSTLRLPPPLLGEHTDEILTMLGYSKSAIKSLRENKVVG
jgi:crotonobetainyl-CoA:carnitine CoA-transferase CaiB-like acyl-CoA transferase